MLQRVGVVLVKELVDNFRDRRTLVNVVLTALLGPVMMLMLFWVIGSTTTEQVEQALELPVGGAEHAPGLIAFLEQNNVVIAPAPDDPIAAVREGEVDLTLLIGPEYGEYLQSGLPAPVELVLDSSRQSASTRVQRAERLLANYGRQLAVLRLQARGISPSVISPLAVEDVDVATPQSRAALLLNILPYFIIFAVFVGGMGLTIDVVTGERERGSLEPLLINPLSRSEFVLGKLIAGFAPTLLSILVSLGGFAAVINLVPLGEQLGVRLSLPPLALLGILLITLPLIVLAGALQMIIATASRTVKEAQSYLGFLPIIPALPGLFLAFVPIRPVLWMMLIPTFGQQLLINQLMRGETIDPWFVLASIFVTLLAGGILTLIAIRFFGREQVLYGHNG
jgi:sodium transport system permease protein